MDIFTQKKFLVRIVILLAVLNIFSIGIFLWKEFTKRPKQQERVNDNRPNDNRPNNNRPNDNRPNDNGDVSSILERELELTETQSEQLKKIRSDFPEKEKEIREILNKERDSINAAMFSKTPDDELIKSLARRIADNEYRVELLRYEQAKELKSICTPWQLEKFDKLIKEIRDYLRDNKPPKKK